MKDDNKSSIIKEALSDYKEIMEAADANAKKKLAEEFPEKFSNLLKEEIKNKNKSNKESEEKEDENKESKKVDDVESNKEESVMKNQKKETKKVVKEGDENQPFEETPKKVEVVKEERDKDFMGDVESGSPNFAKGGTEDGDTFVEKIITDKDTVANKGGIKEEFDVTELDVDSVGSALEGADDNDEVITLQEIEAEINEMEGGAHPEQPAASSGNGGDAFQELVNMRNKLNEMIDGMGVAEQKNQGGKQSIPGRENGGPTQSMIDEEEVAEQKNQGGKQSIPGREKGGPTQQMIDENPISDEEVAAVLGAPEAEEVDEAHGVSFSSGTITPGKLGDNEGSRGRFRKSQNESKKIKSLIGENKKLTKKVNESKKQHKLVESYKSALEKYRNQLKEMAVFNSNLAHVNNLFVNEELALTQEDKIKIINEFKQVDSIAGSQKKYKTFLTEMKEGKKTLAESVEDKVSTSVAPSSKQKLDEVVESTAYENNEHVQKMKRLMEYIDNRGAKKII